MSESKFSKLAAEYYATKRDKYAEKVDTSKPFRTETSVDNNGNHIIELIQDNKVRLRAEYELLGTYHVAKSMWYWAWSIDLIDKGLIKESKKIKDEFPKYIQKNLKNFTSVEADSLFFRLTTANFYTDIEMIDKLMRDTLYNIKGEWFLTICRGRNDNSNTCETNLEKDKESKLRIEYILLKKILTLG